MQCNALHFFHLYHLSVRTTLHCITFCNMLFAHCAMLILCSFLFIRRNDRPCVLRPNQVGPCHKRVPSVFHLLIMPSFDISSLCHIHRNGSNTWAFNNCYHDEPLFLDYHDSATHFSPLWNFDKIVFAFSQKLHWLYPLNSLLKDEGCNENAIEGSQIQVQFTWIYSTITKTNLGRRTVNWHNLKLDNSKLGSTQQQKICWHWRVARIISSQKIYGLYARKHHTVEMRGDVTDAGRTNKQTNIEDWATQPMEARGWVSQYEVILRYEILLAYCVAIVSTKHLSLLLYDLISEVSI